MNKRVEAIIAEARKLAPHEQDELVRRLVLARDDDEPADGTPEEIEAAWIEEVERRIASVERGESELIPYEEVISQLRQRLVRT